MMEYKENFEYEMMQEYSQPEKRVYTLFDVFDGIVDSDYCEETMNDFEEIWRYAMYVCDMNISDEDAELIQSVYRNWRIAIDNSGNWSSLLREISIALTPKNARLVGLETSIFD
jgi:hypothetical protein